MTAFVGVGSRRHVSAVSPRRIRRPFHPTAPRVALVTGTNKTGRALLSHGKGSLLSHGGVHLRRSHGRRNRRARRHAASTSNREATSLTWGAGNQGIPLPVLPCGVAEAKPSLPFRLRLSPTRRLWSRRRRRDEALSALPGDREEA